MRTLFVLAALVAVACAANKFSDSEIKAAWKDFKATHSKSYSTHAEESFRMKIFRENKEKIAKHNARFENGEVSFKMAVNKHADKLSHEIAELKGFTMTNRVKNTTLHEQKMKRIRSSSSSLPTTVDWREEGYVTAVKDQGSCGSCWSFSTTGSLEGQLYASTGTLTSLSEQQLVDCSSSYGNEGCDGGSMDYAFEYIQANGGIDTESSYPYTGEDGTCSYSSSNSAGTDSGYTDVSESESALQEAVAKVGPISVAIDASSDAFNYYSSGIFYEASCSTTDLDHGVLVVGYGTEDNEDYWLVKNSWGTDWGIEGYIMMRRNDNNMCGIASMASYPLVSSSSSATTASSNDYPNYPNGGGNDYPNYPNGGGNDYPNGGGNDYWYHGGNNDYYPADPNYPWY